MRQVPVPLGLAWLGLACHDAIKQNIHAAVTHPGEAVLHMVAAALAIRLPETDRAAVQSLAVDAMRWLQEGMLVCCGLRAAGCGLRAAGCGLRAAALGVRRVESANPRLTVLEDRLFFDSCLRKPGKRLRLI